MLENGKINHNAKSVQRILRKAPLDAAEGVLIALLGLDLKVEGARGGGASSEVHARDLLKAQVHRGLVHVNEAPLQRIQQSRGGLIRARDALGA